MLEKTFLADIVEFLNQNKIHFNKDSADLATTDFDAHMPELTIYPRNRDDMVKVLRKLNELKQPFHVVSAGHNWGYGDSNLTADISILIHLLYLNGISNYDGALGTVEIEPGVTQEQLVQFLNVQKSNWALDVTGSDRFSSVVGNFLERGFGHTSAGDHEKNSKVVEVVTVDGRSFCPHFVSANESKVKGLYQHDLGLNLDRIFYQTSFAIVTKMAIHLKPKNEQSNFCIVFLDTDEAVGEAIQIISRLKVLDILASIPHIGNAGRIQKTTQGKVDARMKWVATIDISGPTELVGARTKILKEYFANRRKLFFSSRRVKWLERLVNWMPEASLLRNQFENIKLLNQIYSGVPTDSFVRNSVGTDANSPKKMNWIGPLFPSQAEHFLKVKHIVNQIFIERGLVFSATVSIVSSRCAVMIVEITDSQGKRMSELDLQECYRECHKQLWGAGYPIYRYGLSSGVALKAQMNQNSEYLKIYKGIKKQFDPNDLFSRNRWGVRLSD